MMFIIDPLALRNSLLSLSFISFAISAFSTSYNTMSTVEAKLQKRIETTEKGIPYKRSHEYITLKKTDLLKIAERIKLINTCIAVILLLSLITILVEPVDNDKYSFVMSNNPISINVVKENKPDNTQLILNLITTLHKEDFQKDDPEGGDTTQDEETGVTKCAVVYFWVVAVLAVASGVFLWRLIHYMLKLQKIQVFLLKLEKEQAFREG